MEHHGATGPSVPPARWWGPSTTTVANADVVSLNRGTLARGFCSLLVTINKLIIIDFVVNL